eukprot:12021157-Alexandrium_andersonii.AAC.1
MDIFEQFKTVLHGFAPRGSNRWDWQKDKALVIGGDFNCSLPFGNVPDVVGPAVFITASKCHYKWRKLAMIESAAELGLKVVNTYHLPDSYAALAKPTAANWAPASWTYHADH